MTVCLENAKWHRETGLHSASKNILSPARGQQRGGPGDHRLDSGLRASAVGWEVPGRHVGRLVGYDSSSPRPTRKPDENLIPSQEPADK